MWKLLPLLNSKLCKFSDSESIHFKNIPSPWKLGAETQNQEEAGKRDESVKVYILESIFWNLTVTFRISVNWNEIRIGDKKTGLRRILPRFIDWILWHQLILIVLSQESYHQDQAQCQGGSGHRKSPRRASAKVIVNLFCDGFLNWWILFSPKIILQIHVLIHPVKTPGRGSLGDIIYYDFAFVILNDCEIILICTFLVWTE